MDLSRQQVDVRYLGRRLENGPTVGIQGCEYRCGQGDIAMSLTSSLITRVLIVRVLTALLGCSVLAACSSGISSLPRLPSANQAEYLLQPGDEIRVSVQNVTDANGTYIIDGSGAISLPLLQEVQVAGLSLRSIERAIGDGYLKRGLLKNPVVSVQPGALRPFYVIGEVNRPGEQPYRQGMTVLSAVAAAGGYTYRAAEGVVEVIRNVDGREIRTRAMEESIIMPGDRIIVHERWF